MSLPASQPPLSLYVHIPWCVRKCPYCDFNSHESKAIPETEYVAKCLADLSSQIDLANGRALGSIFFGGGTPSLFGAGSFARIIEAANTQIGFVDDIEITMETNPGTTEYHDFEDYLAAGINRLSFGIQSFNDQSLQALGRIHNSDAARTAFYKARNAGYQNINIDLMHGLPNQSLDMALEDLRQGFALEPDHVSWYQLTIEANTAFFNRPPTLPAEETTSDILDHGIALLAEHGYQQYEVSAFSQLGFQSKHNLNYWTFGDYLGVGAGAHGKITGPDSSIIRTQRTRAPAHYLNADFQALPDKLCKTVAAKEQILEFMMNALRLVDGTPKATCLARTQLSRRELDTALTAPIQAGLLQDDPDRLVTTTTGYRFLDTTLSYFA